MFESTIEGNTEGKYLQNTTEAAEEEKQVKK